MDVSGVTTVADLTNSAKSRKQVQEELDTFLKLLTTQLQNQDPTEPMDTNQMFEQFSTLTMVQQTIDTNDNLEKLVALAQQSSGLVSYLGQHVTAEGNLGVLENGEAEFNYRMPEDAKKVTISITSASGAVVYSGPGAVEAGDHTFVWNGKDTNGNELPDGIYKITVKAEGETADQEIEPVTFTSGIVTGVSFEGDTPTVTVGNIVIPVTEILSVRRPDNVVAANTSGDNTDDNTDSPTEVAGSQGGDGGASVAPPAEEENLVDDIINGLLGGNETGTQEAA